MKLQLDKTSRLPHWPAWAVALTLLWLAMVGVVELAGRYTHDAAPLCLFKRFTGLACPTCGLTRGCMNILSGRPLEGWACNPLMFSLLAVAGAILILRVVLACQVRLHLTPKQRRWAWIAAALALAGNWIYVAVVVG